MNGHPILNVTEGVYSVEKVVARRCALHDKGQQFWSDALGRSKLAYPWKMIDHTIFQKTSLLKDCDVIECNILLNQRNEEEKHSSWI